MRHTPVGIAIAMILGLLTSDAAHAALTTAGCLAQKQKAWGGFRKCEAGEKAMLLQGKPADLASCQTKLQGLLDKLTKKATHAAIACRYQDNGDGTVTDYDTGLQWEQKTDNGNAHDVDNTYTWCMGTPDCPAGQPDGSVFVSFLGTLNNGTSGDGTTTSGCFAGHCDWRVPAIEELAGIFDTTQGNCGGGSGPCIDQTVFGSTVAGSYWSASTVIGLPPSVWGMDFGDGLVFGGKHFALHVRGVRSSL